MKVIIQLFMLCFLIPLHAENSNYAKEREFVELIKNLSPEQLKALMTYKKLEAQNEKFKIKLDAENKEVQIKQDAATKQNHDSCITDWIVYSTVSTVMLAATVGLIIKCIKNK